MGKHCGECPLLAVRAERDFMQEYKISTEKIKKNKDVKYGVLIKKMDETWHRKIYREVPFRRPTSQYGGVLVVIDHPGYFDLPDAGWEGEKLSEPRLLSGQVELEYKKAFALNGIDAGGFYVASALKCYNQKRLLDRNGKELITDSVIKDSLKTCRQHLLDLIQAIKPRLIITMGDMALKQVAKTSGISKKRGKLIHKTIIPTIKANKKKGTEEVPGVDAWVFPTFNPNITFIDQSKAGFWASDIRRVCDFIKRDFVPVQAEESGVFEDVESIRPMLDRKPKVVAFDTETQGLDYTSPNSLVISYSVSDSVGMGYNIWLYEEVEQGEHTHVIKWERGVGKKKEITDVYVRKHPNYDQKVEELRELLQNPEIKIVMMNGNYDIHRSEQLGIPADSITGYVMDVGSAAHAWDSTTFKNATLGDIQGAFCPDLPDHKTAFGAETDKGDMLFAAKQNKRRHTLYAGADGSATLACALEINRNLSTDPQLMHYYKTLAHPVATEVLYEIEKNGIHFDRERLPHVKQEVATLLAQKEQEFILKVPTKVLEKHRASGWDLTKARFISDILYSKDGWHLKPMGMTPTGLPAVGRKLLIRQRDELPDDHPAKEALNVYIEWGPYKTLYKTFLMGFDKCVRADGKLHFSISKTFTETGRTAVKSPNLQQIPKRNPEVAKLIRSLLKASPGKTFIACDASQAELRWIAHRGYEQEFTRVYKEGLDIHTNTARLLVNMSGKSFDDLPDYEKKAYRTKAKACIAEGSLVLTDRGLVKIEEVLLTDKVWDGEEWVSHDGVIYRGYKEVITYSGLTGTPDHVVYLKNGGRVTLEVAKRERLELLVGEVEGSRLGGLGVNRERCGAHREDWEKREGVQGEHGALSVREHRERDACECVKSAVWEDSGSPRRMEAEVHRQGHYLGGEGESTETWRQVRRDASEVQHPHEHILSSVRGEGDRVEVREPGALYALDAGESSAPHVQESSTGPDRQQRALRAWEFKTGISTGEPSEQADQRVLHVQGTGGKRLGPVASAEGGLPGLPVILELHDETSDKKSSFGGDTRGKGETKARVYDIINAGPRHRFTVSGRVVANCNFGFVYGLQANKFQSYARDEYGVILTLAEAEAFRAGFFELYKDLPTWHSSEIEMVKTQGFCRSDYGFIRRLPNIHSSDFWKRAAAEREGINTVIQSASSDTTLLSALEATRAGMIDNKKISIILFTHDELVIEADDDLVEETIPKLVEVMSNASHLTRKYFGFDLRVPFLAEAGYGKDLGHITDWHP